MILVSERQGTARSTKILKVYLVYSTPLNISIYFAPSNIRIYNLNVIGFVLVNVAAPSVFIDQGL